MANGTKGGERKINQRVSLLDLAARKLLGTVDPNYGEQELLSKKDREIQDILDRELEISRGVSNGNILDFVNSSLKERRKNLGDEDAGTDDTYGLFTKDIGNLFGFYQDLNKNRFVEMADLKFISKFIPAVSEAVKVTLDSIVGADDFSTSISRQLIYGPNLTDTERAAADAEIMRIEKEEKLLKKMRNIVYKKTLVTGNHYVYVIPYKELFEEYDRLVKDGVIVNGDVVPKSIVKKRKKEQAKPNSFGSVMESTMLAEEFDTLCDKVTESLGPSYSKDDIKEVTAVLECGLDNVGYIDTPILTEALEGVAADDIMKRNIRGYSNYFSGNTIIAEDIDTTPEGTVGDSGKTSYEKFDVKGCYIKYIDATKLVPVKVYNRVIGYIHVHDMTASKKMASMQNAASTTAMLGVDSGLFTASTRLTEEKKNKSAQAIVDVITDSIIHNFSNKFVNKHIAFRHLIADCIVANGLTNSAFKIQFIPEKYIKVFAVNSDEDDMGQSILQDALFPAKMLLSTLVSKLLLFMNKSGNRTVAYVRKGPIDVSTNNHVQRTIRMLQESNITFSDLLSTNISFHKFSRSGNIQLPMARNGDRLIDFEVQEGQEVDMRTPMEEYLEKLTILGTGVPDVIMEYTNAADYAKSIVTANIKFASRVATLQSDLEESTTEFYKVLIENSNMDDALKKKILPHFEFKLSRPQAISNTNLADAIGQVVSNAEALSQLMVKQDDQNPDTAELMRIIKFNLCKEMLPYVQWDNYDTIIERSQIELAANKNFNAAAAPPAGDDDLM